MLEVQFSSVRHGSCTSVRHCSCTIQRSMIVYTVLRLIYNRIEIHLTLIQRNLNVYVQFQINLASNADFRWVPNES